jgi:serine/threonine-protein kinase
MTPPLQIAHYKITAKLGEGGMGVVYRATDTKLHRDVAIKVLPETFAQDRDRMARFEREARVLASLNHPNLATIHGVEDRAIVMELVEGRTLAGPMSLDEALPIIGQLIDALEYAHEKGIVHRDLKPANIKVTPDGRVKVLDFGLAKALAVVSGVAADPTASPTLTMGGTAPGAILGTAAYMAPEQARGRPVDKRADIWAFGVVVYEMLAGRRLFEGDSISDTLSAVLTKEPEWERVPMKARRLLRACLEKDPKRRLRDIGDAAGKLEETAAPPIARSGLPWAVAGVTTLAAILSGLSLWRAPRAIEPPLVTLDLDLGAAVSPTSFGPSAVLSADGTRLAFVSQGADGKSHLSTRRLDQPKVTELAGTEGAYGPFFSPDAQWIGFFAEGKLKKIRVDGGAPMVLCEAPAGRGASWGEDNRIVASLDVRKGLSQVSSEGGIVGSIAATNPEGSEFNLRWPQILPGGKAVLYSVNHISGNYEASSFAVVTLADHKKKILLNRAGMYARYLSSGHLAYLVKGKLVAARFDLDRLQIQGPATPILDEIATRPEIGFAQIDFTASGTTLYRKGSEGLKTVHWLRNGAQGEAVIAEPNFYSNPRVSPDGSRLAVVALDGSNSIVWVYDLQRGSKIRLRSGAALDSYPVWSADGRYLVFGSAGGLFWARSDGANAVQPLLQTKSLIIPSSFAADGSRLAFHEHTPSGDDFIRTVVVTGSPGNPQAGPPENFIQTTASSPFPALSPDGRWLAYTDAESGSYQVQVRAFPDRGEKWQISTAGGGFPLWSRKRPELYFRTLDGRIMVANFAVKGGAFVAGPPRLWSSTQLADMGLGVSFDLAPDGDRIAAVLPADRAQPPESLRHASLVLNFFAELRRKVK